MHTIIIDKDKFYSLNEIWAHQSKMIRQTFQQKLISRLSPQQIQLIRMLQIPTLELDQRIKEELESNPALEEGGNEEMPEHPEDLMEGPDESSESDEDNDIDYEDFFPDDDTPDYKLKTNNHSAENEEGFYPLGANRTFRDLLENQLGEMDIEPEVYNVALYIIGNLDDDGYLRRELLAIKNDLLFSIGDEVSMTVVEQALRTVQELEPPGVGARDLRECLILQIQKSEKHNSTRSLALRILTSYFDDFSKKHYQQLAEKLNCTTEVLRPAIELILQMNPKPGNTTADATGGAQQVTPDFMLTIDDGELKLTLNARNAPELRISREYRDMLARFSTSKKKSSRERETLAFVKQKIENAQGFIDAIKERNQMLLFCVQAIVNYQKAFFLSGDEADLRPMILKDIAEITAMEISNISRITSSKFIQTPHGTYVLKYFFTEGLSTEEGDDASSREVKKILREAIHGEPKDKPLADEKLMEILNNKGYHIARRTVAKYREAMGIPVARLRKTI